MLLVAENSIHIDVSLGAMPFEEHSVARATKFSVGDSATITTCSAEDLIVHKAFAGRDKDWSDIRGIITRQGDLDTQLVWSELLPLLEFKDDPYAERRLRELLASRQG